MAYVMFRYRLDIKTVGLQRILALGVEKMLCSLLSPLIIVKRRA